MTSTFHCEQRIEQQLDTSATNNNTHNTITSIGIDLDLYTSTTDRNFCYTAPEPYCSQC